MEKGNIISKLNIKDYSKMLEGILVDKPFSEDTKNILLNMLYKIENAYADYKTVKVDVPTQKDILEEIIELIRICNKIEIIKPKTVSDDLKKCKVNYAQKEIQAYPKEMTILYSLYMLGEKKYNINESYEVIKPSVERVLNIGRAINISEIIRDFDGWSWNINKSNIEDISINYLYQTLNILIDIEQLDSSDIINQLEERLSKLSDETTAGEFLKRFYQLSIIINILEDDKEKQRLIQLYQKLEEQLKNISNRKGYLEQISLKNKNIRKELEKIDLLLNDDLLLKKAYIETNKTLSPEERVFSLSDFSEIQERKKTELLNLINENNRKRDPIHYIKEKTLLEERINLIKEINLEDCKKNKDKILNQYMKLILSILKSILEKIETKKEIIDLIYKMRYFEQIPISKHANIQEIQAIKKQMNVVEKEIITKACMLKTINIISPDISENYAIIKSIIDIGIIDLESINIELKKQDGKYIVNIYEDKSIEKEISFQKISELNIKLNKMMKLFI